MVRLITAEFYTLRRLRLFQMIFLSALVVGILNGFAPYTGYQVYSVSLIPELFDAILVSAFTAAFVCTEFSNRTYGNAFLCGVMRQNVFFAKLVVYFPGLFILILIPLVTSTAVATLRNGFGAGWATVALEVGAEFLVYILYRFSMAGFAILVASVIQNPVATLGLSAAGIYLAVLTQNSMENSTVQDAFIAFIIKILLLLSVATFIFIRRDLKF